MTLPQLQPGDIFCTRNPMALGRAINFMQRFWAKDNASTYSHAGIIIDRQGTTFEALWTVTSRNIFEDIARDQILIGRHLDMKPYFFSSAMSAMQHYQGRWYPFHRLFLHLLPPLAKYVSAGSRYLVCSELVGKFLSLAGLIDFYKGKNPDDIADMIRLWRAWEIVYEGILADEPDLATMETGA